MKSSTVIAIFLILLLSLSPALAATYVVEHDDEVDQIKDMQARSDERAGYDAEIAQLRQRIEELRSQYAQQESDRITQDYYDRPYRYDDGYGRCDREDLDDLDDLLDEDEDDLDDDDRRDLRRLLRRCGLYDDDYRYDNFYGDHLDPYGDDRYCRLYTRDYADNFSYDDYLDDVYRAGRCARSRLHLRRSVFDDYFDDFEDRYRNHDTSYDPYTDVLHELDDRDFYKYGPGAYASWGRWCERNRYIDGTLPDWCYERKRFITDVEWD